MKLKKFAVSAPLILIGAVALVIALLSVVSNFIAHRMASSFEETQFALLGQVMQSKLLGAENKAMASAEMLAALPNVKAAFAARQRPELLAATQGAFAVQREKYGLSQAQFHLAPATSFLRVHNPDRFGEDQSKYRQIVLEVNRTQALRKGIEITTSGIGIFGTMPMTDAENRPTGSFEMALDVGPLLDEIKKDYGVDVAFYADEKLLRETATALKSDVLNEQNRFGQYVKFHSTHSQLMRSLVTSDDINVGQDNHYVRSVAGLPYGVLLQPVQNYAKQQIGMIAVAKNFGATRSADRQAVVWQTLLAVIAIVMLTGVVLVVLRGLLLSPLQDLSNRFDALSAGDHSQAADTEVAACVEIQQLAVHYEQLRSNASAATVKNPNADGAA
jgi:HAMP domain-containing protein